MHDQNHGPSASASVVIRSVNPNPLLVQLLESLERQRVRPAEVVVVAPEHGVPVERWESMRAACAIPLRIVLAPKGMVTQRAAGIAACRTRWALLADDDAVLPDGFLQTLLATATQEGATCVVPEFRDGFPTPGKRARTYALFGIAVPSDAEEGPHLLAGGGYSYPLRPLPAGRTVPADTGAGIAVLVDAAWSLAHGVLGDAELQMADNAYALREDAALVHSHVLQGGRVVMVNAGRIVHLGGTTRGSPDRVVWAYEANLRNHVIFWRRYVLARRTTAFSRMAACAALLWYLIGIGLMACGAATRGRTTAPVRGLVRGMRRLVRALRATRRDDRSACSHDGGSA